MTRTTQVSPTRILHIDLTGHIKGGEGIEFISIETSLDYALSHGRVEFVISNATPFSSGLRINFSRECNFLEGDLDQLVQEKGLSKQQREVFERAAPEIGEFYYKVVEGQRTRKKRILELALCKNMI